jgi:hypothetical protein
VSKAERIFLAAFGAFLAGVGVYAAFFSAAPAAWVVIGGLVLVWLGGDAVHSAWRCKPSLLSRIGPLP